jgi:hypothetical protein
MHLTEHNILTSFGNVHHFTAYVAPYSRFIPLIFSAPYRLAPKVAAHLARPLIL